MIESHDMSTADTDTQPKKCRRCKARYDAADGDECPFCGPDGTVRLTVLEMVDRSAEAP